MKQLRRTAEEVNRILADGRSHPRRLQPLVNGSTLHSVTNYALHKALYSGHNDHNYFEIAHTVKISAEHGRP